jgi:hypothetical protein
MPSHTSGDRLEKNPYSSNNYGSGNSDYGMKSNHLGLPSNSISGGGNYSNLGIGGNNSTLG